MLTKNDFTNLRYLIGSRIHQKRMDARSVFKRLRRKVKRAVKERKWPEPTALTPDAMLAIVRNKLPTQIRGQLATEFAKEMSKQELGKEIIIPFDEIVIQGGPAHDFIRGFIDRPWQLVHQTGVSRKYENATLGMKFVTTSKVIDRLLPTWRVDLPAKKRAKWQSIIDCYLTQQHSKELDKKINQMLQQLNDVQQLHDGILNK